MGKKLQINMQKLVRVFQSPVVVTLYVLGCISLMYHLLHGFQSAFRTLGVPNGKYISIIKGVGFGFAVIVSLAFAMMPVSVYLGWVVINFQFINYSNFLIAMLDSKIPAGPLEQKWNEYKGHVKLVNPANKRKIEIIVVGTGLAGASAAASLAEMGYKVKAFCFQDSPRRAHSIAAQGGINAAKNYQNDGDSVFRLFYDTVKGGDYRSRESNVHRLAEVSANIIDQCVAQGVPFAREYGGILSNRSFGGTQVQRTFYAAGQTGQQLLIGAYQALERQVALGNVTMYSRHEMQELVMIDGKARGIITRNLVIGQTGKTFWPCRITLHWRLWKCILFVNQCHGMQCYCNLESA